MKWYPPCQQTIYMKRARRAQGWSYYWNRAAFLSLTVICSVGMKLLIPRIVPLRILIFLFYNKLNNYVIEKMGSEYLKKGNDKICFAWNALISPNFPVWEFCGKAQFPHSFGRLPRNYAEMCLSTKFPHQEIRWNYGILRSAIHRYHIVKSY